jgi:hypothetical protein
MGCISLPHDGLVGFMCPFVGWLDCTFAFHGHFAVSLVFAFNCMCIAWAACFFRHLSALLASCALSMGLLDCMYALRCYMHEQFVFCSQLHLRLHKYVSSSHERPVGFMCIFRSCLDFVLECVRLVRLHVCGQFAFCAKNHVRLPGLRAFDA